MNSSRYPGSSSFISVRDEGAGTIWSVFFQWNTQPDLQWKPVSSGRSQTPSKQNKIRRAPFCLFHFDYFWSFERFGKCGEKHSDDPPRQNSWPFHVGNLKQTPPVVMGSCCRDVFFFFPFFFFFLILALALCDVNCMARCAFFFSIPNGDNVTGPKEKSWRLAYHVRPAMLCVSFFPCWNSFSLCCCVCMCGQVLRPRAANRRRRPPQQQLLLLPLRRPGILLFLFYFIFLFFFLKMKKSTSPK